MNCVYIITPAMICVVLLIIHIHIHFTRHGDAFGVNAGYYLSGDGVWAGQMQAATAGADGATGLVPAPKAGQHNAYLRGDGTWAAGTTGGTPAYTRVVLTSGTNWSVPNISAINVLVVGGGGGGGAGAASGITGGGGGAGGSCILNYTFAVVANGTIAYSIGAGGAPRSNGGDTVFGTLKASGGFAPDGQNGGYNLSQTGGYIYGGTGISVNWGESGGGGAGFLAGTNGIASKYAGSGGHGLNITIDSIGYWYGGGGGGGGARDTAAGYGGFGGGGHGGSAAYTGSIPIGRRQPTNGTANTGGGGGGCGDGNSTPCRGGSGVIVIWY